MNDVERCDECSYTGPDWATVPSSVLINGFNYIHHITTLTTHYSLATTLSSIPPPMEMWRQSWCGLMVSAHYLGRNVQQT